MSDFGLGRLPSIDPRNELHPMRKALAEPPRVPVPDSKTWSFSGDVLNQLKTGTCTAHAGVHTIHCSPFAHRGFDLVDRATKRRFTVWDLYRFIVTLDEYPENDFEATAENKHLQMGSSGTGVAKALQRLGLIEEYLWAAKDDALRDSNLWVLTRGPVMVGTNWYPSMFDPTPEGFIKIAQNQRPEGGHEWVIRATNMKRAVALGVNSWGPGWNANATGRWGTQRLKPGHFLIDFGTLERLYHEDGDAVSVLEKAA